jgi:hypothetical protein
MEVTGFDNVRLPIYQSFTHNGFYNNFAYGLHCEQTTYQRCNWGSRATVVVESIMCETLINWQSNIIKPCHFHDHFSSIVMERVVTGITYNLLKSIIKLIGQILEWIAMKIVFW